MISAQTDQVIQDHLIGKYMMLPNQVWDEIINQASRVSYCTSEVVVAVETAFFVGKIVMICKAVQFYLFMWSWKAAHTSLFSHLCVIYFLVLCTNLILFHWLFQNVDILKDPDVVKQLANILKTNVRACKALGHPFVSQVWLRLHGWIRIIIRHCWSHSLLLHNITKLMIILCGLLRISLSYVRFSVNHLLLPKQ